MFENPEIAVDELPATDNLDWTGLQPEYAFAVRLVAAMVLAIIFVALTVLGLVLNLPRMLLTTGYILLALAAVIAMVWPGIAIKRRAYAVRDKDILFRKGVIWQSVTAVPFNRIQHVETSNTPIDRKFGLAKLQLFTAGGSSGDLRIDGLGAVNAEKLRVYILNKAGAAVEHA